MNNIHTICKMSNIFYNLIYKNASRHSKIEEFLITYRDFLMQNGIDTSSMKLIGEGDMGQAYLTSNNKIIKATSDSNEILAAERLQGKHFNHLANIDNVVNLTYTPGWDRWNNGTFGVIIEELIIPLSSSEQNEFDDAVADVIGAIPDATDNFSYPFHRSWERIERMKTNPGQENELEKGLFVLKNKFQLDKILQELGSAGIKVDDFHSGNFGKKLNGNYVLFDIGGPNMKVY